MSIKENETLARRFEEATNTGNMADVAEYIAPTFSQQGPGAPQVSPGPQGFRELNQAVRAAFPDFHLTIEDMVAAEDRVAVRYRIRGTHRGEWLGIPPTGKQFESVGVDIIHIANGKITQAWSLTDDFSFWQQLGVVQPLPVAQATG